MIIPWTKTAMVGERGGGGGGGGGWLGTAKSRLNQRLCIKWNPCTVPEPLVWQEGGNVWRMLSSAADRVQLNTTPAILKGKCACVCVCGGGGGGGEEKSSRGGGVEGKII